MVSFGSSVKSSIIYLLLFFHLSFHGQCAALPLWPFPSGAQDDNCSSEGCTWATMFSSRKRASLSYVPLAEYEKLLEASSSISQVSLAKTGYWLEKVHLPLTRTDSG